MNRFLSAIVLFTLLLTSFACNRNEAVEEARRPIRTNEPVVLTNERGEPDRELDADQLAESQRQPQTLQDDRVREKVQQLREDQIIDEAITFIERRINLTEEQKEQIRDLVKEEDLGSLGTEAKIDAMKKLRKRIRKEVLTMQQILEFKRQRNQ